jgi:hypothetical protein
MELLGDVDHVEPRFSLFGDGVSVSARYVYYLRQTFHRLRNCFGHPMVLLGYVAQLEAHFDQFGDSANPDAR